MYFAPPEFGVLFTERTPMDIADIERNKFCATGHFSGKDKSVKAMKAFLTPIKRIIDYTEVNFSSVPPARLEQLIHYPLYIFRSLFDDHEERLTGCRNKGENTTSFVEFAEW